jgi:hypothetical protein
MLATCQSSASKSHILEVAVIVAFAGTVERRSEKLLEDHEPNPSHLHMLART